MAEVSEQSVRRAHQQQLTDSNNNNDENTIQMVDILGGIDKIMSDYLTGDQPLTLNQTQLININQLIISDEPQQDDKQNVGPPIIDDSGDYYFSLSTSNTYLHLILNKEKADKYYTLIQSKTISGIWALAMTIYLILEIINNPSIWSRFFEILSLCIINPILFLQISLLNVRGFKLIRKSFTFWFKVINAICYAIAITLDFAVLDDAVFRDQFAAIFIERLLFGICLVGSILYISSFDALFLPNRTKIIISFLLAIMGISWLLYLAYDVNKIADQSIIYITDKISFSIYQIKTSTWRVGAILACQQAIAHTYYGKDKCVILKYTPLYIWKNNGNNNDMIINEKSLNNLFQITQHMHNDANIIKIVNVMGGIDEILRNYLSANTNRKKLSQTQLNEMHDIMLTPQTSLQLVSSTSSMKENVINDMKNDKLRFLFDESDCYLYYFLGIEKSKEILAILKSKVITIILCVGLLTSFILSRLMFDSIVYSVFTIIFCIICTAPFCIIWISSANKMALKLILTSFEFWFKIVYGAMYLITKLIYNFGFKYNDWKHPNFVLSAQIFWLISLLLAMIGIFLFDGVNMKILWKVIPTLCCAFFLGFTSLYLQLTVYTDGDDSIVDLFGMPPFSLLSIQIGASRVISIFLWKQAILTIYRGRKKKCVLIKYFPYIKWQYHMNAISVKKVIDSPTVSNQYDMEQHDEEVANMEVVSINNHSFVE